MLFVTSGPFVVKLSGVFETVVAGCVKIADTGAAVAVDADDVALVMAETDILADFTADDGSRDRAGVVTGDMRVLNGGPFKNVLFPDRVVTIPPLRFGRRLFELGVPDSD